MSASDRYAWVWGPGLGTQTMWRVARCTSSAIFRRTIAGLLFTRSRSSSRRPLAMGLPAPALHRPLLLASVRQVEGPAHRVPGGFAGARAGLPEGAVPACGLG